MEGLHDRGFRQGARVTTDVDRQSQEALRQDYGSPALHHLPTIVDLLAFLPVVLQCFAGSREVGFRGWSHGMWWLPQDLFFYPVIAGEDTEIGVVSVLKPRIESPPPTPVIE